VSAERWFDPAPGEVRVRLAGGSQYEREGLEADAPAPGPLRYRRARTTRDHAVVLDTYDREAIYGHAPTLRALFAAHRVAARHPELHAELAAEIAALAEESDGG
jgi:hypothetical protein